jgi:hypothetical protein
MLGVALQRFLLCILFYFLSISVIEGLGEVVKLLLEKGTKKLQFIITKSLHYMIYIYCNNFNIEGPRGADLYIRWNIATI